MDEYMNSGMEPEVKKYFRKIIRSFSYGFLWIFTSAMAGIYYQLALPENGFKWYNYVFYLFFIASFVFLIRFLYRTWKNG